MIRRRLVIGTVVAAAVALCCGGVAVRAVADPTGYDDRARATTVEACTRAGGSASACTCVYDTLAATLPFTAFRQLDDELTAGGELDAELVELLGPCSRLPA